MRIGLAGLGAASTEIINALKKNGNVSLTAGCDVRAELRDAFVEREGGLAFESVEAMAASGAVDVVYVATPNHLHCDHVVAAASAGKDVIVEKPMALTLAECDRMIEAAKTHGTRLLAGHTHSFDAPVVAMRRAIDDGLIGDVYMINQWYYTDWLYRGRLPDELDVGKGGGVVYRQGPHGLDIIRLLADRPVRRVKAFTTSLDFRGPTHGSYTALIEFDGAVHSTVVFSGYSFFDTAELTFGLGELGCPRPSETNGRARAFIRELSARDGEEDHKRSVAYGGAEASKWQSVVMHCEDDVRKHPFYGLTVVSGSRGDMRQSPDGLYIYDDEGRRELLIGKEVLEREAEINILYEAWRDDVPLAAHDGSWARDTLELVLAIIESAESGVEVRVS